LDYDITGDRYAVRLLRDLAPGRAALPAIDSAIAIGDSLLRVAKQTGNPSALMLWGGPIGPLERLQPFYASDSSSRGAALLNVLLETRRINGLFLAGRIYESNHRRAELNKSQFMRFYREAQRREGTPPKVMLKFGASHMYRGLSQVNVLDLGNLMSEIAASNGARSFHILIVGGPDSRQAQIDPTVFRTVVKNAAFARSPSLQPFMRAAQSQGISVFDMRPLREMNQRGEFGVLPDQTARIFYAFDLVIVCSGAQPQDDLMQ
jgi:hypothetical protein